MDSAEKIIIDLKQQGLQFSDDKYAETYLIYNTTFQILKRNRVCFENMIRYNLKNNNCKYGNIYFDDLVTAAAINHRFLLLYGRLLNGFEHDLKVYMNELYFNTAESNRIIINSLTASSIIRNEISRIMSNNPNIKGSKRIKFKVGAVTFDYGKFNQLQGIDKFYDLFSFATLSELIDFFIRHFYHLQKDILIFSSTNADGSSIKSHNNIIKEISNVRNLYAHNNVVFSCIPVDTLNHVPEFVNYLMSLFPISYTRNDLINLLEENKYLLRIFVVVVSTINLLCRDDALSKRKDITIKECRIYIKDILQKINNLNYYDSWVINFKIGIEVIDGILQESY
ncbi:Abi family protein [Culicoidibacter larvae]|nr:Abi family protein [Culicoidibacter larvae]